MKQLFSNFKGDAFGGITAIYVIMINGVNRHDYDHNVFVYIFVGVLMLLVLGLFLWKVNEPKLVKEQRELSEKLELYKGVYSKTESHTTSCTRTLNFFSLLV